MNLAATTTFVIGGVLGLGRWWLASSYKPVATPPRYRDRNGKWRTLSSLGAPEGLQTEGFVARLSRLLEMDPTTPKDARAQFHTVAHHLQRFFTCLSQHSRHKRHEGARFRVLVRKQSLRTLGALNDLATLCCGCREIEEVYRYIGELQTYVQTLALRIDK